jgi:hypothetical protein
MRRIVFTAAAMSLGLFCLLPANPTVAAPVTSAPKSDAGLRTEAMKVQWRGAWRGGWRPGYGWRPGFGWVPFAVGATIAGTYYYNHGPYYYGPGPYYARPYYGPGPYGPGPYGPGPNYGPVK